MTQWKLFRSPFEDAFSKLPGRKSRPCRDLLRGSDDDQDDPGKRQHDPDNEQSIVDLRRLVMERLRLFRLFRIRPDRAQISGRVCLPAQDRRPELIHGPIRQVGIDIDQASMPSICFFRILYKPISL